MIANQPTCPISTSKYDVGPMFWPSSLVFPCCQNTVLWYLIICSALFWRWLSVEQNVFLLHFIQTGSAFHLALYPLSINRRFYTQGKSGRSVNLTG